VVDDIVDRVESFLNGEVEFMVYGLDVVGDLARRLEIRGILQPHAERMQRRPPSGAGTVVFDALRAHTGGN
jgi:hypothetical protein